VDIHICIYIAVIIQRGVEGRCASRASTASDSIVLVKCYIYKDYRCVYNYSGKGGHTRGQSYWQQSPGVAVSSFHCSILCLIPLSRIRIPLVNIFIVKIYVCTVDEYQCTEYIYILLWLYIYDCEYLFIYCEYTYICCEYTYIYILWTCANLLWIYICTANTYIHIYIYIYM